MVFFFTALLVLIADQLSKIWIRSSLDLGESLFDIGLFRLTHIQNTGAAFGLFQDQSFALTIIAIISIVALLVFFLLFSRHSTILSKGLSKPALGLILGGTIGNLVDRLRLGCVTDFIDFGIWPAFNIADSAITVGVILFAYCLLSFTKAEKH